MTPGPTFQHVILELQRFWAGQGCVLWQPYYAQLGAGTMNPATFLRVLGPEPWRVAYVEPSIRPDDGRYGENPNRMQQHYQFQVILKPDPGNPQEIYLDSLRHLGIDPRRHDIRFVEDNWESPVLAAWGLGWEVWLDGLEITQYTYFQQAGGLALDPVSVEITYGIDRIVMALQRARHFSQVQWSDSITYGELLLEGEREHSTYYFEAADIERMRRRFDDDEAEARAALDRGLLLPAYDNLLRCSHTFNILDTRGVIGVTERAVYFGRMRDLSRRIAAEQVARREKLGFPLGVVPRPVPTTILGPVGSPLPGPETFVLEIGTEELPHRDAAQAREDLLEAGRRLLAEHGLEAAAVETLGTPRRLVLILRDLQPTQKAEIAWEKGPPADRAFDASGEPTAAALGWARKQGLPTDADSLQAAVQQIESGRYLMVERKRGGDASAKVLRETVLPSLLAGLRFDRAMRWVPQSPVVFSRPMRWLLALHGDRPVPFEYAGLIAGSATRGLRSGEAAEIPVRHASEYATSLREHGVVLDPAERSRIISSNASRLAAEVDGTLVADEGLLQEVVDLVEAPVVLRGRFEEEYLGLPRPVLVAVMRKYQRTFAVERAGTLLPHFLVVANGTSQDIETVREGNENVLRARFADAAYFVRRDLEQPLEAYRERLGSMLFHSKRGTMLEKSRRLEALVARLGKQIGLSQGEIATAQKAAHLCKADLATLMVVEITSLHGEMGREYALRSGEPAEVADAILDHVLPRAAGGELPHAKPGIAIAIADRLDTLVGLFSLGHPPTGSRDPLGLRRTAIGLIQILIGQEISFDLKAGLHDAAVNFDFQKEGESAQAMQALTFLVERLRAHLLAEGNRHDVVEAVVQTEPYTLNPAMAARAIRELEEWIRRPDWPATLQAFARCRRIRGEAKLEGKPDEKAFREQAERDLHQAIVEAERRGPFEGSPDKFLKAFQPMVPVIGRFFEDVLVMDEDEALRKNRLRLVDRVVSLAGGVAEFHRLEGY